LEGEKKVGSTLVNNQKQHWVRGKIKKRKVKKRGQQDETIKMPENKRQTWAG